MTEPRFLREAGEPSKEFALRWVLLVLICSPAFSQSSWFFCFQEIPRRKEVNHLSKAEAQRSLTRLAPGLPLPDVGTVTQPVVQVDASSVARIILWVAFRTGHLYATPFRPLLSSILGWRVTAGVFYFQPGQAT